MSKVSATEATRVAAASDVPAPGWGRALEATLSLLRDIDARYDQDYAGIAQSSVTGETRTRLLQELDCRHRQQREPYVLAAADLHEKILRDTVLRVVH